MRSTSEREENSLPLLSSAGLMVVRWLKHFLYSLWIFPYLFVDRKSDSVRQSLLLRGGHLFQMLHVSLEEIEEALSELVDTGTAMTRISAQAHKKLAKPFSIWVGVEIGKAFFLW